MNQTHIVLTSDKAKLNRRWSELFETIQNLPDGQESEMDAENPILDYLFGHRELDRYLHQLRSQPSCVRKRA